MILTLKRTIQTFLMLAVGLILRGADSTAQKHVDVAQVPVSNAAYAVGERLTYNVAFSSYATAAYIETVIARNTQSGATELRAHVETLNPVYVALYPINKDYVASFDQATGATDGGVFDLLAAVYRVRALPLEPKQTYRISVRDDAGQVYDAEIRVIGTERIGTLAGAFTTRIAEIRLRGASHIRIYDPIHHRTHLNLQDMRVYFSDDARHLPVRLTARIDKSDLRVNLASAELPPATLVTSSAPEPTPTPPAMALTVASSNALPFNTGEQLNYNFFLAGTVQPVGAASLQVQRRANYLGRDGLLLTGTVETSGVGARLFPVRDQINSYVDPTSLLPFRSEINLAEGTRRDNSIVTFEQDRGRAILDSGARIEIPTGTYDYLSALYALRLFDLTPPKRTAFALWVNNRPHTFYVNALRRETIELNNQRINAVQLSITTDEANPDKNYLRLWISADKRRLPLRLTANTPLGTLRADLAIIPLSNQ
jgi:hypothetical protein